MAGRVEIVPATPAHAEQLAPRMRAADVAELLASSGQEPLEVLLEAIVFSSEAYAAFLGGELAALFGVVPGLFVTGEAYPWALTSDAVDRHPRAFLLASRAALEDFAARHPVLVEAMDARHSKALRWVRWLGFEVEEAKPFGFAGLPFHRITYRRSDHV